LLLIVVSSLAGRAAADGTIYQVAYEPSPQPGELALGVTYTVWIPAGVKQLRGVIVHQHGCGVGACRGGATAAYDLHWQALARKWDCALLGPSYQQEEKQNCRLWCDPRNGSRKAFLQALTDLGQKSGHPELDRVPWCLWGHSGGGFWASIMLALDPERIVAIWLRSGTAFLAWQTGEIPAVEVPIAAYAVPVMCNPGAKEQGHARFSGAWVGSLAMFEEYRAAAAPIGIAVDPDTAHECGDCRYLAIPYFDACLAQRLPPKESPDQKLSPLDKSQAWLAEPLSHDPVPLGKFSGNPKRAVWLPSAEVAVLYSEYITTGATGDRTPPPAPFALAAQRAADGTIEVTWDAYADFESGLAGFVIQRDGQEVARLPEKPVKKFGRPLFQAMSYHDTPEAPVPALKWVDKSADAARHAYRVFSINSVDLRSPPSEEAVAAAK